MKSIINRHPMMFWRVMFFIVIITLFLIFILYFASRWEIGWPIAIMLWIFLAADMYHKARASNEELIAKGVIKR